MSLTIPVPDYVVEALEERARAEGLSLEEYTRQILETEIAPDCLKRSSERARQNGTADMTMEEIDAEIAAARAERRARKNAAD